MKSFFHHPLRFMVGLLVATAGLAHAQPTPPAVSTFPASAVGGTTATLNGTANPILEPTSGWFQWGTTTNYGNVTLPQPLGSGFGNTNFSQVLTGLLAGLTYHFRAVATNADGTGFGTNQSFTTSVFADIGAGLPRVYHSSVAWGDYDNDGRLDILLTGTTNGVFTGAISQVWRNTGSGFTNINAGLTGVYPGSVAWGDFDNDGRLDIVLAGSDRTNALTSQIWRNTGSGFTNINARLPGVSGGSVAWGDYDNDGRLDILLSGFATNGAVTQVWRNTSSGFADINAGLPGVANSSVAWGDYDNDGRLDILLSGDTGSENITGVWRNTGSGFTDINAGLPVIDLSSVAWGDYDNDGRLDILLTGFVGIRISQVWRNTGSGFTNINAGLPGVSSSSVAWGDYDNDGRLDILLTGTGTGGGGGAISQVWRNIGNGFTNINAGLPGVFNGSVAWGDYDNDGRLDILLTGTTNGAAGGSLSQVWRNNAAQTNTPPTAPSNLFFTVSNSTATLTWNASADAATPAAGLTYNVRIGTTSGGSDVLSPMAGANGFRRLPQLGNAQPGLVATFNYLQGTPYYWSVQAVDSALAGSPFAPESSFKFQPVQLPVTAANVTAGDLNGDGLVDQNELNTVLSNYFPNSPFLQMTNVAGLGGTNVTFALSNSLAGAFSVEYTTNFTSWQFLGPATPRYLFTDTNAPAVPQRFYRLRWP